MTQTPEELLALILDGDDGQRLKLCRLAIDASEAAQECFVNGHSVQIYNLKRHIAELSRALVDAVNGDAVDPVIYKVATTYCEALND